MPNKCDIPLVSLLQNSCFLWKLARCIGPRCRKVLCHTCTKKHTLFKTYRLHVFWELHTSFRLLWPCIMNVGWRERTNKMQLIWRLLSNFYLNMFRASFPSSEEQECALPHMVFCTGCDGCGCVELGRELCALWKLLFDSCSPDDGHNDAQNMLR